MELRQIRARFPLRLPHFPTNLGRDQTSTFLPCVTSIGGSRFPAGELELESRNRMFILGMGFVGQFVAQDLKKEGRIVSGTCTSAMKKKELEERGFHVCLFDANKPELSTLNTLKCYTHLLVSIPPLAGIGDPMLQHGELLRSTLIDGDLQWLCYLSSTSVYGNCGGAWVDEDYPTNPTSEVAQLRLVAEEGWLNLGHSLGLQTQVFRLGGVYGPGRSAIDTIIKQEPTSKSQKMRASKQYTSRVHVEDICQALKASIYMPSSRTIFNVVDDDPAPREEVFAYAEELIEKKWPGFLRHRTSFGRAASCCEMGSSGGEKRVSNERMKKELGVEFLHPSYISGLLSIVDQMENPFQRGSSVS